MELAFDRLNLEKLETLRSELLDMWKDGTEHYHNLFYSYATAHSLLIAAVAFLSNGDSSARGVVTGLIVLIGLWLCLQMSVAMSRARSKNAFMARLIRSIEQSEEWTQPSVIHAWMKHRDEAVPVKAEHVEEFTPNFGIQYHRRWWAPRMKGIPKAFAAIYVALMVWIVFGIVGP